MEISKDEKERAHFRSRKMYETDRISNLLTAEDRGRREGREESRTEGREEGRAEVLRKNVRLMYQKGFSVETIAKTLDLSEEEVNDILRA